MLSNKGRHVYVNTSSSHHTTKLGPNAVQELKINQRRILIDSLEIGIPAPEQMIALGERQLPNGIKVGQLLNSKTLNYKKFTPHRDGLFCERIFGPVQSFVCACGKKKESVQNKSRQKDLVRTKLLPEVGEVEVTSPFQKDALFCPKCQVEYISKNVRRHRLGYIKLFAPVTHIWYLKGRPSYLSLFLGKRKKAITSLAYCNAYLVEQIYSNLETSQVKDTGRSVSEGLTKLKQNLLSAFTQTNNVKIWQNFNDQREKKEDCKEVALTVQPSENAITKNKNLFVTGAEPFFSLLSQLFVGTLFVAKSTLFAKQTQRPEKSVKNFSYLLTKRYKAVTKLAPRLKLPVRCKNEVFASASTKALTKQSFVNQLRFKHNSRSLDTINNRAEQSGYQNDKKKSSNQTKVNNFALKSSSTVPTEKSIGTKFLLSSYVRAQTSPFLPSLICSFHLRDCLISFLQSSPRTEDIPIPLYCQTPRRYPLRDVHKFLTEFRSTTTKEKSERLTSESIKKFTGLRKQAKPVFNKNEVQSLKKNFLTRDFVVHKRSHANFSRNKIDVFAYKIPTKKQKINVLLKRIQHKSIPSTPFLPMVESSSAYLQKPNVKAKIYKQSNTFTRLKVSTLAVNLEGVNYVSMKKAGFLQNAIGNGQNDLFKRNKGISENERYRQLKGLTKQSDLLMPIQLLARKTTMSGILLNTFIDMFLPETASILYRNKNNKNKVFPLLQYKHRSFTPLALKIICFCSLCKTSCLQKRSFCNALSEHLRFAKQSEHQAKRKQNFVATKLQNDVRTISSSHTQVRLYNLYKRKIALANQSTVKSFITPFVANVLSDEKNSVQTKSNKETYTRYFGKTSTHNALVKTKFLPMHYQSKHKDFVHSNLLNYQLIAAGNKFRNNVKLCKGNPLFTNIETYQTRLLYFVFGTLSLQSTELYEGITKPKQSKTLLPLYSFTSNHYFPTRAFGKKEKFSESSEQFFPHSVDLVKPKLIAGLYSNKKRIKQYKNIYFQIYSSKPCTVLVKKRSEKGVTFFSRSRFSFIRNIESNGVFSVSFSINLPFFISGSKQNKVCLITEKENQVEWTTFGEKNGNMEYSTGQTKSVIDCFVRSTAFISSSLPDTGVWSCTLVKRVLTNSCLCLNKEKENVVFLDVTGTPFVAKSTLFAKQMQRHNCLFSKESLANTFIEQRYASKLRNIPHKLDSERYVKIDVPTNVQSNVVSLPFCSRSEEQRRSQLQGSQEPFAQSSKAFTNDRVKANSTPVSEGEAFTQTISKWHINGAKEILSYTGGGALESLLKRFNISLFCQFLFGEIQILRKYYKDQIVAEYNKNNILDERRNSSSQGLNEHAYLRKNKDPFYVPKRSYSLVKSAAQAEVQDSYSVGPERHFGLKYVVTDKNANLFCRRIYRTTRRLKIVQLLMRSKRRPEWMMISVLPVLPPDLRPVLQMGENLIVASDLNTLYQRVIYRNNRHYKGRFLDFHFVSSIHRLVQDAVDRLIENGKGGSTPFLTPGGRPLKSLSDILKGKRGRFRFNLLGKRVDFSGRSVIVVSPNLKIHECGLPREMALELYKYLLIRQLLLKKQVSSIVNAKKLIKQRKPLIWDMLREIIYYHPLLLNRAPTLHRLGIQAFQPKLALGNAILLHPLVCAGFNADFDGDQMGVHLPLSPQARAEAWDLLWSRNNLLSPATGQPILLPSQDMVLGFYYMTALLPYGTTFSQNFVLQNVPKVNLSLDEQRTTYNNNVVSALQKRSFCKQLVLQSEANTQNKVLQLPVVYVFSNTFQVVNAYQKKQIDIHTPIWLKRVGKSENGEKSQIPLELRIDIFGYRTQIYPTYKSKSKVVNFVLQSEAKDRKTSFLTFNEKTFTEHIRTTVGRVLVNNLISKNN